MESFTSNERDFYFSFMKTLGFGVLDSKTLAFDINTPRDPSRWDMSGRSTYKQCLSK